MINPYPFSYHPYVSIFSSPEEPKVFTHAKAHLMEAVGAENNGVQDAFTDALRNNLEYLSAYKKMPTLSKVKSIHKYRNEFTRFQKKASNWSLLDAEIIKFGIALKKRQVLFHGGDWPMKLPAVGQKIIINKAFSTTLDPSVAHVHSLYSPNEMRCVWMITLENSRKPAFICHPNRGKLSHELEVIFPSGLKAEITAIQCYKNAKLLDVLIY